MAQNSQQISISGPGSVEAPDPLAKVTGKAFSVFDFVMAPFFSPVVADHERTPELAVAFSTT